MARHHRSILKTTIIALVIIIAGALIASAFIGRGAPPKEFSEARINAVAAVNNLSLLVNSSLENLKKIEMYEQGNNSAQALQLVTFEATRKQEKQNAAVLLATYLEQMAKSATKIQDADARVYAIEAITSGVSMVSRIVSYNSNLDQLFVIAQERLRTGKVPAGSNPRGLISNLNGDAEAINLLSNTFNDALNELDEEFGLN